MTQRESVLIRLHNLHLGVNNLRSQNRSLFVVILVVLPFDFDSGSRTKTLGNLKKTQFGVKVQPYLTTGGHELLAHSLNDLRTLRTQLQFCSQRIGPQHRNATMYDLSSLLCLAYFFRTRYISNPMEIPHGVFG